MKRIILTVLVLMVASYCQAQCVAEIKDVLQDEARGSIIVETEYTLNGEVIQLGRVRYLETDGTNEEIIAEANEDKEIHCKKLIKRIEANMTYLKDEKLKQQKILTQLIIDDIKDDLVGEKIIVNEVTDSYKGKDIKVTYDEKNIVSDTVIE